VRLTGRIELLCDAQESGGPRDRRSARAWRRHESRRRAKYDLEQSAVRRAADVDQIIPLSGENVTSVRTPFSLFSTLPVRRLEIRSANSAWRIFFDLNGYGSDTNFQFMNWTVDNN